MRENTCKIKPNTVKLVLICAVALFVCILPAFVSCGEDAPDLSGKVKYSGNLYKSFGFLHDGKLNKFKTGKKGGNLEIRYEKGIGSLYIIFDGDVQPYTVKPDGLPEMTAGTDGFLHEYIEISADSGSAPGKIVLSFDDYAPEISEIYVYSAGEVPASVQKWEKPVENGADLVLFATHGDDDQLYFAGLLPLYAGEMKYRVQVVYMTYHPGTIRRHEMIDGLWACGVRNYPVFGPFDDFRIDDLALTYAKYEENGVTRNDILSFVTEQVRRFRPLVAVGHDLDGEFGHGMHRAYSEILCEAVEVASDSSILPESAEKYGVWDTPKTYLHLYKENRLEMNLDIPLDSFDGLTAFQVSQKYGFPCHATQQSQFYIKWLNGTPENPVIKATDVKYCGPCKYGLYRTTVGSDVSHSDMFEHIITYDMQEIIRQEEEERLRREEEERLRKEEERLRQEEEERLRQEEEERLRQEEEERLRKEEEERLRQEEEERLRKEEEERLRKEEDRLRKEEEERLRKEEEERLRQEEEDRLRKEEEDKQKKAKRQKKLTTVIAASASLALLAAVIIILKLKRR